MSNIALSHITADIDEALLERLHKLAERAGTEPDDVIVAFLEARSELHGDSEKALALLDTLTTCIADGADDDALHAIVREAREHMRPQHVTMGSWRDEVEGRTSPNDVPTVRDLEAFVDDVDAALAQTNTVPNAVPWAGDDVTLESVRGDLAKLAALTGRPVDLVEHDAKRLVTDAEALAFAESVKHGHACIDLAAERVKRARQIDLTKSESITLRGGESTGFVLPPSRETYEPDPSVVARVKEGVTRYHLDTLANLERESRAEIVDVEHDAHDEDPFDGLALPKKTPPALRPLAVLSLTTAALLVASGIDARDLPPVPYGRPRQDGPGRARTPETDPNPTQEPKRVPGASSTDGGNRPEPSRSGLTREQRRRLAQRERAAAKKGGTTR